jgi:hypothetical protein
VYVDGFGGTVVVIDDDDSAVVVASGLSFFFDGRGWKKVLMRLDMMRIAARMVVEIAGGWVADVEGEGRPRVDGLGEVWNEAKVKLILGLGWMMSRFQGRG